MGSGSGLFATVAAARLGSREKKNASRFVSGGRHLCDHPPPGALALVQSSFLCRIITAIVVVIIRWCGVDRTRIAAPEAETSGTKYVSTAVCFVVPLMTTLKESFRLSLTPKKYK